MSIRYHSSTGQAAYHDLRRLLQDEAISELRGAPTLVSKRDRHFWYDRYRVGAQVRDQYIGPDTPELRARIDALQALKADNEARRKERSRLVGLLRAEGYASLDQTNGSLLNALSKAGVFRLGGTVVGTVAFRLYEGELAAALGFDQMAQTGDLDIASFERLSFAIGDQVETPLEEVFRELKFSPVPSLNKLSVWKWEQSASGTLVEFLMPAQGEETIRELPALGVSAQALRHLDFILERPIKAVVLYRSGVLVQIPRPEAYAIHKLIVAERRRGGAHALKAQKDRSQAKFLIEALAELRPDELLDSYEDAMARGPRWREQIEASLRKMPDCRAILEEIS